MMSITSPMLDMSEGFICGWANIVDHSQNVRFVSSFIGDGFVA